eukprot:m.267455 g.267455  ORF g.267455 m.267455 type:complete len:100 (+) comp15640_c1_seq3:1781-2080(+)
MRSHTTHLDLCLYVCAGIYWESVEYGQLKYAEYDPFGKQTGFANINTYELFNVTVDPFELYNIYPNVSQALRQQLHQRLRAWYECEGEQCRSMTSFDPK